MCAFKFKFKFKLPTATGNLELLTPYVRVHLGSAVVVKKSIMFASIAIVTGGSGGMGPHIGVELARRGVGTIVFAQRRDAIAAVSAVEEAGGRAVSLHLDCGSAKGVAAFFELFAARFDRLDYLVNCSGDCPRTPIADVTEAELGGAFAVNAAGPFFMCQAARPLMWRSGGGAIVNIGSIAGEDGAFAASIAYSMAKGALKAMMKQLAKQGFPPEAYAPGAPPRSTFPLVRCNNVSPGPVATPMLASMSAADQQKIRDGTLTDGVTGCEEVAKSVRLVRGRLPLSNHPPYPPPPPLPPSLFPQVAFLLLDAVNNTGQTIQCAGGIVRT